MTTNTDLIKRCIDADKNSVQRSNGSRIFKEAADALADLDQQVAALRVDAERWNFVLMTEPYARNLWKSLPKSIYQDERHLNNAIDAAMGDKAGAIRGLA